MSSIQTIIRFILYDPSLSGVTTGCILPIGIVYCYLEFKLRYLKNLKMFSIRVKELFGAYSFAEKNTDGFLLLKKKKKKKKKKTWETELLSNVR